jgi:hypothetical protein
MSEMVERVARAPTAEMVNAGMKAIGGRELWQSIAGEVLFAAMIGEALRRDDPPLQKPDDDFHASRDAGVPG